MRLFGSILRQGSVIYLYSTTPLFLLFRVCCRPGLGDSRRSVSPLICMHNIFETVLGCFTFLLIAIYCSSLAYSGWLIASRIHNDGFPCTL